MNEIIASVVPNTIGSYLQSVLMACTSVVRCSVSSLIPSTSDVTANQANPQRFVSFTFHANRVFCQFRRLNETTNGTGWITPFHQTARVECVITQDRQNAVHTFVHSFETDWTSWQFRMVLRWRSIVAPSNCWDPQCMTELIGFEAVVRSSVVSLIKFISSFNRTKVKQHHELVWWAISNDANVSDFRMTWSNKVEDIMTVESGGHSKQAKSLW